MESVQDGQEYYYTSRRQPVSQYNYANSDLLKRAMARIYAQHYTLEERGQDRDAIRTVNNIVRAGDPLAKFYYTLSSDIHEDSLFSAWLTEQPANSRVFYCRSRREAAILAAAFKQAGYAKEIAELKEEVLQVAIHYTVLPGPLDDYLKACAAVVRFGQYKPSTALLEMPVTTATVSRKQGLNYNRSEVSGEPYVLLDEAYWLTDFMIGIMPLAQSDAVIESGLRELCNTLVRNIALGENVGIRQEALHVANNNLTQLYARVELAGQGGQFACVRSRAMLTLAELIGGRKRRR
jgi:rhodanese-related sulfurtransferase